MFPPTRQQALAAVAVVLVLLASVGIARRNAEDRKSTRLNSSHANISYAVFCLKKNTVQFSVPTRYYPHRPSTPLGSVHPLLYFPSTSSLFTFLPHSPRPLLAHSPSSLLLAVAS